MFSHPQNAHPLPPHHHHHRHCHPIIEHPKEEKKRHTNSKTDVEKEYFPQDNSIGCEVKE
jgi:hypothetical protein